MPRKRAVRRQESDDDEEMEGPVADTNNPTQEPQDDQVNPGVELEAFEREKYEPAIISAASHTTMKAITDSWEIPKPVFEQMSSMITESAIMLTEAGEAANPLLLRELDQAMKDLLDLQHTNQVKRQTAMDLRAALTKGGKLTNPAEMWQTTIITKMEEYNAKTTRQKYANHEAYTSYKEELWQVKNDGPMPPLKSIIPKVDGDESEDDDDLDIGGRTISLKDPLTKGWLEEPMTSKICKHSYSHKSILEYIGGRGSKKCPEAGCDKQVSRADLEANEVLARQVRNAQRREEERKRPSALATQSIDVDEDEIVD